jgi:hypothetical protein
VKPVANSEPNQNAAIRRKNPRRGTSAGTGRPSPILGDVPAGRSPGTSTDVMLPPFIADRASIRKDT